MSGDQPSLTKEQARRVYGLLMAYGGAREAGALDFIRALSTRAVAEYRFVGAFGFGGKFWTDEWRVSCYREDETPERRRLAERLNLLLADLRKEIG